jgi:hypothetical protein
MTNAEKRCCLIMGDNSHSVKQFSGTGSWNRLQSEQPTVRVACSVLPMSRAPERPRRLSLFQNTTSWVPLPAKQSHSPHVVPLLGLTLSLSARWRNPAMAAFGFALAGIAGALRVGWGGSHNIYGSTHVCAISSLHRPWLSASATSLWIGSEGQ